MNASGRWKRPVTTSIEPASTWYDAESYHQDYYERNRGQPYCQAVIAPKLAKLRKTHFERLRHAAPESETAHSGQVRPYQTEPQNPIDQGGIAD